jgi:hypothetical protein
MVLEMLAVAIWDHNESRDHSSRQVLGKSISSPLWAIPFNRYRAHGLHAFEEFRASFSRNIKEITGGGNKSRWTMIIQKRQDLLELWLKYPSRLGCLLGAFTMLPKVVSVERVG